MSDYQTFYLLRFMSEHAILAWCLAWPILIMAYVTVTALARILVKTLYLPLHFYRTTARLVLVLVRGWPTVPNMDADGDIVHPTPAPAPTPTINHRKPGER